MTDVPITVTLSNVFSFDCRWPDLTDFYVVETLKYCLRSMERDIRNEEFLQKSYGYSGLSLPKSALELFRVD